MKVLLGLACVLATSGAVAQTTTTTTTVETTKSVRMDLGKPYANLSLRHYNASKYNAVKTNEVEETDVYLQGRAYIGSKWMNDRIDTYLRLIYRIDDGTTKVKSTNPQLALKVTAYNGDFGTAKVYGLYNASLTDDSSSGNLGAVYTIPSIDLGAGFAFNAGVDAWSTFYGGNASGSKADVFVTKDGKRTKSTEAEKINKADPDLDVDAFASVGYTVPTLSDLSFSLGTLYHTDINAVYERTPTGKIESEYEDVSYTESHFLVGYKLTKALKLDNTLYYYNEDFFGDEATLASPAAKTRFLNRLRLSYKLF